MSLLTIPLGGVWEQLGAAPIRRPLKLEQIMERLIFEDLEERISAISEEDAMYWAGRTIELD